MPLRPLTIVSISGGYGVVLAQTDSPYEEYRIQLIKVSGDEWSAGFQGLFNANEVVPIDFCPNDYLPGLILATAAGYSHRYGSRYTNK